MKAGHTYRDVVSAEQQPSRDAREGRAYVAVIGIDRYRTWNRLYNAVSDAEGALRLFARLGFELVAPPLFDESATGDALHHLVVDDLSGLGRDDSLVLFFAGHGHTISRTYDGTSVRDGYLIPVDGDRPGGRAGTWIRFESWLTEITRIPAKHILVILDACHSGLALGPIIQWRSRGMENARREPLEQLRARRSRRIITSALDDQLAMDGGPVPGHSLFTGCLIEAMTGGLVASTGHQVVTGSEIGHYVQRRVSEYPGSAQTPDFGALELDDRGELLVHIRRDGAGGKQTVTVDATIAGAAPEDKLRVPGAEQQSTLIVGMASQPPNAGGLSLPTRRHAPLLLIGGGVGMVVAGGIVAALIATRTGTSVEDVKSALSGLSDAGVVVVAPADGALAVAPPDAAQHETARDTFQQSSRGENDANPTETDRPPVSRGN
jgi:uncharacterized caspase-like protein